MGALGPAMIDFGATRQSVEDLIEASLSSFAAERPDETWSTFALYASAGSFLNRVMNLFFSNTHSRAAPSVATECSARRMRDA